MPIEIIWPSWQTPTTDCLSVWRHFWHHWHITLLSWNNSILDRVPAVLRLEIYSLYYKELAHCTDVELWWYFPIIRCQIPVQLFPTFARYYTLQDNRLIYIGCTVTFSIANTGLDLVRSCPVPSSPLYWNFQSVVTRRCKQLSHF